MAKRKISSQARVSPTEHPADPLAAGAVAPAADDAESDDVKIKEHVDIALDAEAEQRIRDKIAKKKKKVLGCGATRAHLRIFKTMPRFYLIKVLAHIHTYIHTHIHACIHIYIHKYIHIYIYYIHTYIYIHTYVVHTYVYAHQYTNLLAL